MKNKIIGWMNIVFGILMFIDWWLFVESIRMDTITYWGFTDSQQFISFISLVLLAVVFFDTIIINIVFMIKNIHNKKNMLLYFLTIISMITSIVLVLFLSSYKYFYLIVVTTLFGVILLITNKNENSNISRILFCLGIINIILFIISAISSIVIRSEFEVHFANNERNLIKNMLQLSDGKNTEKPIMVKKNEKWGYIDKNGNVLIDYIYDDCMEFTEVEILDSNKKYYITPVFVGDELRLITEKNELIGSFKRKKITEEINYSRIWANLYENLESYAKVLNLKIDVEFNEFTTELLPIKNQRYEYIHGEEGNDIAFSIDVDKFNNNEYNYQYYPELIVNKQTKKVTFNGEDININGELYIDEENDLQVYTNGFIPFYNFEENIFGWIDLEGKQHSLNGKMQILDFVDDYILVKIYSDKNEKNICFVNYQGKVVSDSYQEISILPNGYIVKKENGKNVYIDKNFQEKTKEYDIIDGCRAEDGILIVANLPKMIEFTNEYIPNNIDFSIINWDTGKIVNKNLEYINGMYTTKYEAKKYDNITDKEYKEIICCVDSEFPNDALYTIFTK